MADCGACRFCLDKPKFGGPNTLKQQCIRKQLLLRKLKAGEVADLEAMKVLCKEASSGGHAAGFTAADAEAVWNNAPTVLKRR